MRIRSLCVILAVLAAGAISPASAQPDGQLEGLRKALKLGKESWKSEPIFFEPTGSYYQFAYYTGGDSAGSTGIRWEEAESRAARSTFKGRRGRLAVIDSEELYSWLLEQWDLTALGYAGATWIGLRYWCPYRALTWSNGEEHGFNEFGPWDTPWYRVEEYRCSQLGKMPYMSVYIAGRVGKWRASGHLKRFPHYIVEYPAPQETAEASEER